MSSTSHARLSDRESTQGYETEEGLREQIADLRAALECERRQVAHLTQTVRMNELFAAVLAHDLRAPLTAILTGVAAVRITAPPDLHRPLDLIKASGARMSRLIAHVLDFTRVRAGLELPHEPTELDLQPIIAQVLYELSALGAQQRVRAIFSGDTRGWWDADRLAQLFSNLIGNALKHGEDGPVIVDVDGKNSANVCIRFRNRGAISEFVRQRLFDPWASTAKRNGLGLGLFIARQVALGHGGDVALEPSDDDETTFLVTLPRRSRT
jgi:signal transduction histidine kinase